MKNMEETAAKFQLSPCPPSAREGEIKREQFRIVPRAQLVPKVMAFMKFQTLARFTQSGSSPCFLSLLTLTIRPCYIRPREVLTISCREQVRWEQQRRRLLEHLIRFHKGQSVI